MERPADSEVVWIEYPEGRRFRATFNAGSNEFVADDKRIALVDVANWSHSEHEDYDISDDPNQQVGGRLTRDQ